SKCTAAKELWYWDEKNNVTRLPDRQCPSSLGSSLFDGLSPSRESTRVRFLSNSLALIDRLSRRNNNVELFSGTSTVNASGSFFNVTPNAANTSWPEVGNTIETQDRKSTRLNSSHVKISYA